MKSLRHSIASLLVGLASVAPLAACAPTALPAAAPSVPSANSRVVLRFDWARTLLADNLYRRRDVDHVELKLYEYDGVATETLIHTSNIGGGDLDGDVVFEDVEHNTTYRVRATAYKAPGNAAGDVISETDDDSMTQFTVPVAATLVVAQVKLRLLDYPTYVTHGLVTTFAVSGGFSGDPAGMEVDTVGNCYTFLGNLIYKVSAAGVRTTYSVGYSSGRALAMHTTGVMYAADAGNDTVWQVPAGGGAPAARASLTDPVGIAVSATGEVYATTADRRVVRVDAGSTTLVAGSGANASTNGSGAGASFTNPAGLTFDGSGDLLVAQSDGQLRKVTTAGAVTTLATAPGPLSDVALGRDGHIYATNATSHVVYRITTAGAVTVLAGTVGTSGTRSALGTMAQFNAPSAMAVDPSGTLFVLEPTARSIRKIF